MPPHFESRETTNDDINACGVSFRPLGKRLDIRCYQFTSFVVFLDIESRFGHVVDDGASFLEVGEAIPPGELPSHITTFLKTSISSFNSNHSEFYFSCTQAKARAGSVKLPHCSDSRTPNIQRTTPMFYCTQIDMDAHILSLSILSHTQNTFISKLPWPRSAKDVLHGISLSYCSPTSATFNYIISSFCYQIHYGTAPSRRPRPRIS